MPVLVLDVTDLPASPRRGQGEISNVRRRSQRLPQRRRGGVLVTTDPALPFPFEQVSALPAHPKRDGGRRDRASLPELVESASQEPVAGRAAQPGFRRGIFDG
ncbi:hypothetical protein [Curtobacterium sp. MWU13-2055]|uniref:hypothetical protein n=1 Tax=Curtobacterium sp. MWU13-2055 TaxID=2931928 RepID=UPI00200C6233|nr:hypothetical protein [Curtobacterium sp. MWU13-2055]